MTLTASVVRSASGTLSRQCFYPASRSFSTGKQVAAAEVKKLGVIGAGQMVGYENGFASRDVCLTFSRDWE